MFLRIKPALRSLLFLLAAWLAVNFIILPRLEPVLVYFPLREIEAYPSTVGLKYEDVHIKTADGAVINGWLIPNRAAQKVILLFHGNGGNLGHRVHFLRVLNALPANVLIIDYHGYGKSQGKPSEANLYLDAEAAYRYLIERRKFKPEQIVVMGSSLGSAVATYLAEKERVGGLILQKPFTSAAAMAPRLNPLYRWPIVLIRSRYDNLARIRNVKVPLLIIHSKDDEMIPYQMSVELYEKANEPKELLLLDGFRHNDIITDPRYLEGLRGMLGPYRIRR